MRRRLTNFFPGAAVLAMLAGCGRSESDEASPPGTATSDAASSSIASVSLVDPMPWSNELGAGVRYRIAVRTSAGVDTIPGVATTAAPGVVGERYVLGFAVEDDGSIASGFVYDARARELRRVGMPPDFLGFTAFALSPGGERLAYAGRAADGEGLAAIVRGWPEGKILYRSEGVQGYPSDDVNSEVDWLSRDSVEIRIRLADLETEGGTWLRARGAPSRRMIADTVRGRDD